MNVKLLRRIQKTILEEPKRVTMDTWLCLSDETREESPCGAVGCIYGWGLALTTKKRGFQAVAELHSVSRGQSIIIAAANLFKIPTNQASALCLDGQWPIDLRKKLRAHMPQTKAYAKIVAKRIDRFIETKGAE